MAELFDFQALGTYLHFKFIFQAEETGNLPVAYQLTASSLHPMTSPITFIIDGVGQYQISIITVKYAWATPIPFICILVLQSGLSYCLMLQPPLTPHSHVGLDSVQTTTIP